MELTGYHQAKIRQTVSNLLGPDTKVYLALIDSDVTLTDEQERLKWVAFQV